MKIFCSECEADLGSLDVYVDPQEATVIPKKARKPRSFIDPVNDVCWNGDTRTAHEFRKWQDSSVIEEDPDHGIIWRYMDGCYIDLYSYNHATYGKSYHVLVACSEASFKLKLEAEIYLWNEHARVERDEQFGRVRLK